MNCWYIQFDPSRIILLTTTVVFLTLKDPFKVAVTNKHHSKGNRRDRRIL